MSSQLQPLILWGGVDGPNPPKVAMVLDELNLPWTPKYIPHTETKTPEYEMINPNGRLPSLEDPNTGITVWESGAILEYLISEYDHERKLSFPPGTPEFYHTKQWLHFQMSGQGPYYGQVYFFKHFHPEKVDSVINRFINEVRRVSSVLDKHLATRQYLVGDKCTYADIAWVPWQVIATGLVEGVFDPAEEFPSLQAWLERLQARPAVKQIMEATKQRAEHRASLVKKL
ncbi:Uncharacterized protein BP5553_10667 [Venustampulla echinocandica]|uniref:glutathione transferase n=1 Tax=Venustampulla echinocandica TaxID=2656787 RepID=A0A370T8R0_9HELO|nr:Uncharacterized protein BP5553_10667 [Venustampulla echinocandica]RDL29802.1 Uncharacterized protein BP5553_10667 [Venustampulla echinocandica]